jgi:surface-anchored protein
MKLKNIITTAALAGLSLTQAFAAPTIFSRGHTDVGIAFEGGAFDLHVHAEEYDLEAEPGAAVLRVLPTAQNSVPSNPAFSFLGATGSQVWILPQDSGEAESAGLLFLGIGSEEIAPGTFSGNLSMALTGVVFTPEPGAASGANFSVYTVSSGGVPTVLMSSHDGIDVNDTTTFAAGGHTHVNWAFSKPGRYVVTFAVTGTPTGGAPVTDSASYTFVVKSNDSASDTQVQAGEPIVVGAGAGLITSLTPVAVAPDRSGLFFATLKPFGTNTALINASNDRAFLRVSNYLPEIIAREGDAMVGLVGPKIRGFSDANASEDGTIVVNATLFPNVGGVLPTNDALLAVAGPGGLYPVVREGDNVPGLTGYNFVGFTSYLPADQGRVIGVATVRNAVEIKNKVVVFRASLSGVEILAATGEPLLTDAGTLTVRSIVRPARLNQPFGHTNGCLQMLVGFTDGSSQLVRFAPVPNL